MIFRRDIIVWCGVGEGGPIGMGRKGILNKRQGRGAKIPPRPSATGLQTNPFWVSVSHQLRRPANTDIKHGVMTYPGRLRVMCGFGLQKASAHADTICASRPGLSFVRTLSSVISTDIVPGKVETWNTGRQTIEPAFQFWLGTEDGGVLRHLFSPRQRSDDLLCAS